jgi:hypothetical protein
VEKLSSMGQKVGEYGNTVIAICTNIRKSLAMWKESIPSYMITISIDLSPLTRFLQDLHRTSINRNCVFVLPTLCFACKTIHRFSLQFEKQINLSRPTVIDSILF